MTAWRIIRTHRKGKPLTRAELLHSGVQAENASRAVAAYLQQQPLYRRDTLVAEEEG